MIVLNQRWTLHENKQVVEALVLIQVSPIIWKLSSIYYDPNQGESIQTPIGQIDRHHQGMMPHILDLIINHAFKWALEENTIQTIQEISQKIKQSLAYMKEVIK